MLKRDEKQRTNQMQQLQHHPLQRNPTQGLTAAEKYDGRSCMLNAVDRYDDLSCSSSMSDTGSEQDWASSSKSAKRTRISCEGLDYEGGAGAYSLSASAGSQLHGSNRPGPSKSHKSTADDERRKVRRERNKLAAARCRQRRVDLTNTLIAETEALENEKVKLEKEIENLYRLTNELQFVLNSHATRCPMMAESGRMTGADSFHSPVDLTAIKTEKPDPPLQPITRPENLDAKLVVSRPNSLPLPSMSLAARSGVASSTPFSGPCMLTLDFLADGHTGLTPLTGLPSAAEVPSSVDCLPSNPMLMKL